MKIIGPVIAIIIPLLGSAADITISGNLPGVDPVTSSPLDLVNGVYRFALMIGGLLAFGSIVYAGVKYAVAAGDSHGQSDAKDQITQALLGLVLLAGAALILRTINPSITNLSLPSLSRIEAPTDQFTCPEGSCKPLEQCVPEGNKAVCKTITCTPSCDPEREACTMKDGASKCEPIIRSSCNPRECSTVCSMEKCDGPQKSCLPGPAGVSMCKITCPTGCSKGFLCYVINGVASCLRPAPEAATGI
jgi:hypothetical protein